jgi:hypothetical protein
MFYLKNEMKFELLDKRLNTTLFVRDLLKSKDNTIDPNSATNKIRPAINNKIIA